MRRVVRGSDQSFTLVLRADELDPVRVAPRLTVLARAALAGDDFPRGPGGSAARCLRSRAAASDLCMHSPPARRASGVLSQAVAKRRRRREVVRAARGVARPYVPNSNTI